eukprot:12404963-Karenia_brevis.AAC.1
MCVCGNDDGNNDGNGDGDGNRETAGLLSAGLLGCRLKLNSRTPVARGAGWRNCILNAPLQFKVYPDAQAIQWARINAREDIGKKFQFLYRSCIARIFEVCGVADNYEEEKKKPATCKEVAKLWNDNVSMSQMSESVSD